MSKAFHFGRILYGVVTACGLENKVGFGVQLVNNVRIQIKLRVHDTFPFIRRLTSDREFYRKCIIF